MTANVAHDRQRRPELLLELRKGTRVIDMRMAVDHDLDVFGLKPSLRIDSMIIGPDEGMPVFIRMCPSEVVKRKTPRPGPAGYKHR